MTKLVTIFGGSGFVGRYIARRMAKEGWRVRVAVRRPNEALFVRPYGVVGQVDPILANIRDDASVRAAIRGADAVVNCVGLLTERGKNQFGPVQAEGAARVATIAAEEGVAHLVHMSAIGADPEGNSKYAKSKGQGEAAVLEAFPNAVILRPSIIFGTEDEFFNRFARMASLFPVLKIVGADTLFQPVHVDDVAQAAVMGVLGTAAPGTYELGGPDTHSLRQLLQDMLHVIRRRRLIINLPFWMGRLMGRLLDAVQYVSLGLIHNSLLTRDQAVQLAHDNVASADLPGFADLGIVPVAMDAVLEEYLWPYRPGGQYSDIQESARDLRA